MFVCNSRPVNSTKYNSDLESFFYKMNCNTIFKLLFKVSCFLLRKVWEQQSRFLLGGKLQYKGTKLRTANYDGSSCSRNKSFCFSISQPKNNCVRISVKKRTIRDYASSVLKRSDSTRHKTTIRTNTFINGEMLFKKTFK